MTDPRDSVMVGWANEDAEYRWLKTLHGEKIIPVIQLQKVFFPGFLGVVPFIHCREPFTRRG